jgi:D-lyxose ketol-isomerase
MDELKKALAISLTGRRAAKALADFRRRMAFWRMKMPPAKPLVLDFGLGDFEKIGLIEYWIANEVREGYCGKYLFVFNGQICPMHRHRKKHETFFIVKGHVAMTYAGKRRVMGEGAVLPVARWKYHSFTGIGPALLLEVSTPCEVDDNYFKDCRVPIGGNYRRGIAGT